MLNTGMTLSMAIASLGSMKVEHGWEISEAGESVEVGGVVKLSAVFGEQLEQLQEQRTDAKSLERLIQHHHQQPWIGDAGQEA